MGLKFLSGYEYINISNYMCGFINFEVYNEIKIFTASIYGEAKISPGGSLLCYRKEETSSKYILVSISIVLMVSLLIGWH